jgi:hypothetical protein
MSIIEKVYIRNHKDIEPYLYVQKCFREAWSSPISVKNVLKSLEMWYKDRKIRWSNYFEFMNLYVVSL